jgi:Lipocalin-like domain
MNRSVFYLCLTAGVALAGASTGAQQAPLQQTSLKERLVGTWTVVSQYTIAPDGKREEVYGAKPIGRLTFDGSGRFSYILFNPGRPKFASRDKNKGTAEEYAAVVQGGQAYFGTFSVNDANDRIVYHIEGALEPSWQDTDRTGASVTLVDDELKYNATTPATGVTAYQVWKRMK